MLSKVAKRLYAPFQLLLITETTGATVRLPSPVKVDSKLLSLCFCSIGIKGNSFCRLLSLVIDDIL